MKTITFRRSLVIRAIILFVGAFVIPSITQGTTIYVDDDNTTGPWYGTIEHPYQHIQDGINNANSGDTVYVYDGTYYENVDVDKTISLIGEDRNSTVDCTPETGHKRLGGFGTDWYFDTKKGWCHESETEVQ